jgi:hypothetical protein
VKFRAAIIRTARNKRKSWNKYNLITVLETDTLADISIKLDELNARSWEDDDDFTYDVYFLAGDQ